MVYYQYNDFTYNATQSAILQLYPRSSPLTLQFAVLPQTKAIKRKFYLTSLLANLTL